MREKMRQHLSMLRSASPLPTRDGAMRDMLLTPSSRITTQTRITAEPGPQLQPGDLGVIHDGSDTKVKEQLDSDVATFRQAVSTLSPAERAKLMESVGKFSGRAPSVTTPLGISHNDSLRGQRDATAEVLKKMNQASKAFWE